MAPARIPSRINTGTFSRREVLNPFVITPPAQVFPDISLAFAVPSAAAEFSRKLLWRRGMRWEVGKRSEQPVNSFSLRGKRRLSTKAAPSTYDEARSFEVIL